MAGVRKFEDLVAWQMARELVRLIYRITGGDVFSRDYDLRRQIRRAAVSIMANIAEGFERFRRAEFHQFLSVAKSSCAELRSHLYVALDAGYLSQEEFDQLEQQALTVARTIGALRASLGKS